jgi:mRNA interferase HigB
MNILKRSTLIEYWKLNPNAEIPLRAWFDEAKKALWETPHDIKQRYPNASFVAGNRVVFNIGGNNYRLVVKIEYHIKHLYIRFIGTHSEYDKINVETI